MTYAVLSADNTRVENVIVCGDAQREAMAAALGRVLVEASAMGLEVGDVLVNGCWMREMDGEMMVLPIGADAGEKAEMRARMTEIEAALIEVAGMFAGGGVDE